MSMHKASFVLHASMNFACHTMDAPVELPRMLGQLFKGCI